MADDTNRKILEEVRKMPDEELAACQADILPTNLRAILAREEQERRRRIHQHELDLNLIARQVRWMKFTAILSAVMTVIGTIIGALLTWWLQGTPPTKQPESKTQPTLQESGTSTSVDRKEKDVSVP